MRSQERRPVVPSLTNTCAIVVSYHPDAGFPDRLKATAEQVDKVIIVDNNSHPTALEMVKDLANALDAHLIANEDNVGIGAALNQGMRYARSRGYFWALTLDQDTATEPTLIQDLRAAYCDCPFRTKVGIVAANFIHGVSGKVWFEHDQPTNQCWLERETVITSGNLVSVAISEQVGPFREDFFLDGTDFEYCLRLRAQGYRIILSPKVSMTHFIGHRQRHSLLGVEMNPTHHDPIRSYYRARNHITLAREFYRMDHAFAWDMLKLPIIDTVRIVLFEQQKLPKVKNICLGLFHGLTSKSGKLHA